MHNLDLRFSGKLEPKFCKILTQIAKRKLRVFNKLMGYAYQKISNDKFEYFVCSPASSRNPFASKSFFYFCCFFLLKKIQKKKYNISKIYTDSYEFKLIIKDILNKNSKIEIIDSFKKKSFSQFTSFIYFLIRILIIKSSLFFVKKKTYKNIFTVLFTNVIKNHTIKDRYFVDIKKNIINENIFTVPNILIFNYLDLFKSCLHLRKNNKFILKEDYINILDVLSFYRSYNSIRKINLGEIKFLQFNFSKILYEDLVNPLGNFSIFESMLNIKFISKICKKITEIKTTLIWFENQNIDRSISFAINKYYPNISNFGYKGVIPPNLYLSQHHTIPEDRLFNIIPKKIFVMGKGFLNEIKKYDKKLNIEVGPALRFAYLWKLKKNLKDKNIIVALPILYEESFFIIDLIKDVVNTNNLLKYKFIFIPHPTHEISIIKKYIKKSFSKNMIIKNYKFTKVLETCFAVISGMSSTCLESIAAGKKTVIIEFIKRFSFSCVPGQINKSLYLSTSNVNKIINYLLNTSKTKININMVKNLYFCKPTVNNKKLMLNL